VNLLDAVDCCFVLSSISRAARWSCSRGLRSAEGCCHVRELTRPRQPPWCRPRGHHVVFTAARISSMSPRISLVEPRRGRRAYGFRRRPRRNACRSRRRRPLRWSVDREDVRLFGELVGDFENAADLLDFFPRSSMWVTMRSTFRLMLPIESLAFETVCSPERAPGRFLGDLARAGRSRRSASTSPAARSSSS